MVSVGHKDANLNRERSPLNGELLLLVQVHELLAKAEGLDREGAQVGLERVCFGRKKKKKKKKKKSQITNPWEKKKKKKEGEVKRSLLPKTIITDLGRLSW